MNKIEYQTKKTHIVLFIGTKKEIDKKSWAPVVKEYAKAHGVTSLLFGDVYKVAANQKVTIKIADFTVNCRYPKDSETIIAIGFTNKAITGVPLDAKEKADFDGGIVSMFTIQDPDGVVTYE